ATRQDQGAKQDRRYHDAPGPELREIGDDHRRESVSRGDVVLETMDRSVDLGHPGETGQRPADREDDDEPPPDIDACIAGRPRAVADQADLVAEARALEEE